uniref:Putative fatty acid and hydrocarbon transporter (SalD) n=1 Tax=mine drainage metagenome TaxID=410659 RepID=E6PSD1_9ZZZZ
MAELSLGSLHARASGTTRHQPRGFATLDKHIPPPYMKG